MTATGSDSDSDINSDMQATVVPEVTRAPPVKLCSLRVSAQRCTCSMQGEKEQNMALALRHAAADGTPSHGRGRSKNTASARPWSSSGNPSPWMSLTSTATSSLSPLRAKSSLERTAGKERHTAAKVQAWAEVTSLRHQAYEARPMAAGTVAGGTTTIL